MEDLLIVQTLRALRRVFFWRVWATANLLVQLGKWDAADAAGSLVVFWEGT